MAKTQDRVELDIEKRDVTGKKVKHLRKESIVPANVYGKDIESQSIQVDSRKLLDTFREAGETQVIYLELGKEEIPVLIASIQVHPVSEEILHADFRKVDLTVKTEASVPVEFLGEEDSPALKQNIGDLLTLVYELTVEALPTDMPQKIEVDISGLKEVDDEIRVADLKSGAKYEIKAEDDQVVVKIAEHKEEELEAQIPDEEELPEGAVEVGEDGEAPAEGEEGEAPADGEAPAEGAEATEEKEG